MAEVYYMQCCGIRELDQLSEMTLTRKGAIEQMAGIIDGLTTGGEPGYDWTTGTYVTHPEKRRTPAFFIFSQAGTATKATDGAAYGDYFRDFIHEEGLGTVVATNPALNENSGNLVTVYTWTVDQDAFKKWDAKAALKRKPKKEAA